MVFSEKESWNWCLGAAFWNYEFMVHAFSCLQSAFKNFMSLQNDPR